MPEHEQSAFSVAQFTLQYTTPVTEITHGGTISYALTLTNLDVVSVSEVTLSAYVPNCMEYVPDTLQSTLPDMTYDSRDRRVTWQGTVTAQQVITSVKMDLGDGYLRDSPLRSL